MEYRPLGNSGLLVSVAGLGANQFGRRCDLAQTKAVVHKALDLGVNFIDTADRYAGTLSEQYLGRAIQGHRHDVIIATKFGTPMHEGPLWSGASRRYITAAVQASLKRLGVDHIDLYQIHYPDPRTPIEETMRALDDLVHRGDVRYIGCSNFSAWQVVEAQLVARFEHLTPFISAQNEYSLVERSVERELMPVCSKYGLGVIPFFPLAEGLLTGKYRPGQPPPVDSHLDGNPMGAYRLSNDNFILLAKAEAFAQEQGHTIAELALAWLAAHPEVSTVIAGATRPEQVEENVRAFEWHLTAYDMAALDEILGVQKSPPRIIPIPTVGLPNALDSRCEEPSGRPAWKRKRSSLSVQP